MTSLTAFLHKIENRATSILHKCEGNAEVLDDVNSEVLTAMCVLIASLKETEKVIANAIEAKKTNTRESESIVQRQTEYLQKSKTTSQQSSSSSPSTTNVLCSSHVKTPLTDIQIDNMQHEMKALRKRLLSSITWNLSANNEHSSKKEVEEESNNIKLGECKRERSSSHSTHDKEKKVNYDDTRHAERKTSEEINLGQYSETDAFDDNQKKRERFAKLMGGAKHNNCKNNKANSNNKIHHTTHAVNSDCLKTINNELIGLFDSALAHKGKKGLGA